MVAAVQEIRAERGSGRKVVHLVMLVHHEKGLEASFRVETDTADFTEVWREIRKLKAEQRLFGYDVTETMALTAPF